jgi:MoaA/NifB/PqqE/SkfB family radical SAM enzyme
MTKKLEEYEWMCPDPFVGVSTSTTGNFRPCCVMAQQDYISDADYKIDKNSYQDFYDSDFMKSLREALKTNDSTFLNKHCSICKTVESSGNRSARQWYLQRFNKEFYDKKEELEDIIHNNKPPSFYHIVELDALGGNYCNLSCSMCNDRSSSTLLKEKMQLNEPVYIPLRIVNGKKSHLIKLNASDKFQQELPRIINSSKEIKMVGGEPLLCKEIYDSMQICENKKDVIVRIITNGTIDPDKFIALAKQFKRVIVNVSIEGYSTVNDYIRYPSKWNNVMMNYNKLLSAGFEVTLCTTINAINIARLHEIPLYLPNKKYSFSSYVGNNFYSVNSIPDDIKKIYLVLLNRYKRFNQIDSLINYLENSTYNESQMISMIQHIKRRDNLRNTNFVTVFPEWKRYYNEIIS